MFNIFKKKPAEPIRLQYASIYLWGPYSHGIMPRRSYVGQNITARKDVIPELIHLYRSCLNALPLENGFAEIKRKTLSVNYV